MDMSAFSLENKLLLATPAMRDPRFRQAVIYVCSHDTDGAMGIVVNRPKRVGGTPLHLTDLLEQIGVNGAPRVADTAVLEGGPVDVECGFVLHSPDYGKPETTLPISDHMALTSTRDVLDALVTEDAPERAVLAIGYAGWGEGQIEAEIAGNAWIVCDPDDAESLVFNPDHAGKWAQALGQMGIDPAMLSAVGGRASLHRLPDCRHCNP